MQCRFLALWVLGFFGVVSIVRQLSTLQTFTAANTFQEVTTNASILGFSTQGVCVEMALALQLSTWAPVRYHKDVDRNITGEKIQTYEHYYSSFFDSLKEDDDSARSTIAEFNRVRQSVLTKHLLDAGLTVGGAYPSRMFVERMASGRPLQIAVFGTSFTIGSNCGESSSQDEGDCAWPNRLARRWAELFPLSTGPVVDWHMWQENAQGSVNIAQKLPAVMESFITKNVAPDAILLDNTIIDLRSLEPWFEVVVRALVQAYPEIVLISVVDGIPDLVNSKESDYQNYYQWLRDVHRRYGLAVVDIAEMVRVLRNESKSGPDSRQDSLWPQAQYMINASNEVEKDETKSEHGEIYWANFTPRVRKTKGAYYPSDHPPWPTHQYVADSVAYALLTTAYHGCLSSQLPLPPPPLISEETVAPKSKIDACPVCLAPLSRINAKSPPSTDMNINGVDDPVTVVCGDWKWVTDDRNRAGWQSDEVGSLIRFRLKISADPLITMTYMASHSTFGDLRVTFRTPEKPPLACGDISNMTLPSLTLEGWIPSFSLSQVIIFPARQDTHSWGGWKLLNATVLGQSADYVDLYVENPNKNGRKRVKIQMLTSC